MTNEEDFISGYLSVVGRAWHDGGFRERLRADPRAALVASGWAIPAGAVVTVVATESLDIVRQVAGWRAAAETGRYVLHLPLGAVQDLTDEQLQSIVGGALAVLARLEPTLTGEILRCHSETRPPATPATSTFPSG
jgi:hypothetical protein